ncbi:hypothetical protein HDU99_002750 [Rhizoclosmatium hyalinum]|nr:hypothetical protein HDU99_002750 [Rhizoclosmatium hyalinum]
MSSIANLIDTPEPHDFSPHESLPDALVAIELPSTAPTASLSSPQSPLKLDHRPPSTKQEPETLSQHPLDEFDLAIKLSFDVAPASVLDSRDGNEERRLEDSSSLLVSRKRKLESENEDEDADYVSSKKVCATAKWS